jgi:hypothetical protein
LVSRPESTTFPCAESSISTKILIGFAARLKHLRSKYNYMHVRNELHQFLTITSSQLKIRNKFAIAATAANMITRDNTVAALKTYRTQG